MLEVIIIFLSFYGMTYLLKESSILSRPRNWIMLKSTFVAQMLFCWFCSGAWSALMVYGCYQWHYGFIFLWCLAGATFSLFMNAVITRLTWYSTKD